MKNEKMLDAIWDTYESLTLSEDEIKELDHRDMIWERAAKAAREGRVIIFRESGHDEVSVRLWLMGMDVRPTLTAPSGCSRVVGTPRSAALRLVGAVL